MNFGWKIDNLGLRLLALIMAILLWLYVHLNETTQGINSIRI